MRDRLRWELLAGKKWCTVGPESHQLTSGIRLNEGQTGLAKYLVELSLEKLVKACEGMNEG